MEKEKNKKRKNLNSLKLCSLKLKPKLAILATPFLRTPFLRAAQRITQNQQQNQRGLLLTELLVTIVLSGIGMLLLTNFILATARDSLEFQSKVTAEEISLEIASTVLHPFLLIEDVSLSSNNAILNKNYEALKFLYDSNPLNQVTQIPEDIPIYDLGGRQLSGTIGDPKYFDIYGGHCANPPDLKRCHFKVESKISSYCLDQPSCIGLDVTNIKISYVISKITPSGDYQTVVNKKINTLTSSYTRLTPEIDSIPPEGQLEGVAQITVGEYTSCALVKDENGENGTPYCWGSNGKSSSFTFDTLGIGPKEDGYDTAAPQKVTIVENGEKVNITQLVTGKRTNCALSDSGQAHCWGQDQRKSVTLSKNSLPTPINQNGVQLKKLSVGSGHSCGLSSEGNAYCWGRNREGQSGTGSATRAPKTTAVAVNMPDGVSFSQISAGDKHSCALGDDGNAYCWGANDGVRTGVLGDGTGEDKSEPTRVALPEGVDGFSQISAGDRHSCALSVEGNAYCWGKNSEGEIGDGTKTTRLLPKKVGISGIKFSSLSLGRYNSCATVEGGGGYCWGKNTNGMFGVGDQFADSYLTPVLAYRGIGVSQININSFHSCAIATDGSYHCAGSTSAGKLGEYFATNQTSQPKTIKPKFDQEFVLTEFPYSNIVTVYECDVQPSDTSGNSEDPSFNTLFTNTSAPKCSPIPKFGYDNDGEVTTTNWEYINNENRIEFIDHETKSGKWYTFKYYTLIPGSVEYLSSSE